MDMVINFKSTYINSLRSTHYTLCKYDQQMDCLLVGGPDGGSGSSAEDRNPGHQREPGKVPPTLS